MNETVRYPMVPIRDVVVYPHSRAAFIIGRNSSMRALETASSTSRIIFLASQHDAGVEEPTPSQIHQVGTLSYITSISSKPEEGIIKVQVEGRERARLLDVEESSGCWIAHVEPIPSIAENIRKTGPLISKVISLVDYYLNLWRDGNIDQVRAAMRANEPGRMLDQLADCLRIDFIEKQQILETVSIYDRALKMINILELEIDKLSVDHKITAAVKKQMDQNQKEYYLNEKIKAIHKELGRKTDQAEFDEIKKKIEDAKMSVEANDKAINELKRLEQMPSMSPETTVSRTFIEWLINIPWKKTDEEIRDLKYAAEVLDADHYGLERVKERILEYLSVRRLIDKPKGSILCFVGPPGVGKTSLGRSIAKATGRKFVQMSLGGVRDEAEIRGHRRTYIGALPGQIIHLMKKAGTINPIVLLDEVDKLGADQRGDPSAALLEVLDPEQNHGFHDHYIDVDYDLSRVMFIVTANVLHTIPRALLDRLEVIKIAGYTEREKLEIAKRHLISKQAENNGLKSDQITFTDGSIKTLIEGYTRESGVRNLDREIGALCRKTARRVVEESESVESKDTSVSLELITNSNSSYTIDSESVSKMLGPVRFRSNRIPEKSEIGLVNGLAVTETGGDTLQIEATLVEGTGKITLTGKLGSVMQESAHTAITYIRSRSSELGISQDQYKNYDLHVHVPEGAIPKDGPSAGITMATAMASAFTKIPVHKQVAMTGEITLRGKVLPIGGVKEKLLAAHRCGITNIILSRENEKDLVDIPQDVLEGLQISLVDTMDEVLKIALERATTPSIVIHEETKAQSI